MSSLVDHLSAEDAGYHQLVEDAARDPVLARSILERIQEGELIVPTMYRDLIAEAAEVDRT